MITTSRFVDEGTKFISFDEVSRFTDKGSEFVEFDSAQSYAAVHAPKGGVTLQGKFYPGGEFIPGEALSGLSPLETGFLKGKMKKAGESMPQSQAPKPQPEESKILSKETLALAGQPEHQVRPVKGRAKHNNEWYSSVTPEEGKALAAWIDDAFGLRDCLNGKDCTDETALALDALVERAPPYRGKPVYRGMSLTPADAKTFYKQLQGKRAFKWKAPTSSSKDEEIASEFAMLSNPHPQDQRRYGASAGLPG